MASEQYKYFSHTACEYFPCHPEADRENFNCLFCYCPLYVLGERCGGQFTLLPNGMKNCTGCLFPHRRENYPAVMEKLRKLYFSKTEQP